MFSSLQAYDREIFGIINGTQWPEWFASLLIVLGKASPWIAPVALTFLILAGLGNRRERLYVATALITLALTSLIVSDILKPLIARVRPCHVIESVRLLGGCTKSFAMPSEHSANAFAQAVVLGLFYSRALWISLPFAGLIGLSRIVHGKHYPSDVLAGAVLGILLALTVVRLLRPGLKALDQRLFRGWTGEDSMLEARRRTIGSPGSLCFIMLAIGTGARAVYAHWADLSPQEAVYWEKSRSIAAWDWLTHPPLEVLAGMGTHVFGDIESGVRCGALFLSLLTSVILYFWARRIFPWSRWAAPIAALGLLAAPVFGLGGARLSSVTLLLTLWTGALASADVLSRGNDGEGSWLWLIWGICVGIAGRTDSSALLLIPLTGLYLAFTPGGRRHFHRLAPYIGLILAIGLMMVPWIAAVDSTAPSEGIASLNDAETDWLKLIVVWPMVHLSLPLAVLIAWGALWAAWMGSPKERREYVPLACLTGVMGGLAIAFHALGVFQTEWAPGWIPGWICLVGAMTEIFRRRNFQSFRLAKFAGLVIFLGFIQTTFLLNIGLLRKLDIKRLPSTDPSAQVIGWRSLGKRVNLSLKQMGEETVLLATNPMTAAELSFYTRPEGKPLGAAQIKRIGDRPISSFQRGLPDAHRRRDGLLVMVGEWREPPDDLRLHYASWKREDIFRVERKQTGTIRLVTLFRLIAGRNGNSPNGVAKGQEIRG